MRSILIFLVTLVVSLSVVAAPHEGKVVKMEFGPVYTNIVFVDIEGDTTTQCATNSAGYDYSFDSSTPVGEKVFSVLLAAQRSQSSVKISGTGACSLNTWSGNTEDINWVQSL